MHTPHGGSDCIWLEYSKLTLHLRYYTNGVRVRTTLYGSTLLYEAIEAMPPLSRRVSHQRAATPENSRRTRRRLLGAAADCDSVLAPLVCRIAWTEVAFALGCNALVYGVASAKASVW